MGHAAVSIIYTMDDERGDILGPPHAFEEAVRKFMLFQKHLDRRTKTYVLKGKAASLGK